VPNGWFATLLVLAVVGPAVTPPSVSAQAGGGAREGRSLEVRVWLDRGVDAVLQPGDRSRVYYRASEDAYVALVQVDTDGVATLLYPRHDGEPNRVRGGRDYRLIFSDAADWLVHDAPGVGYFFILASRNPLDFGRLSRFAQTGEWNLARTGARIRQDPHVAIDGLASLFIVPEGDRTFALDFTGYHVGQSYSYPRFLCYECHVPQSYEAWNPYRQACPETRIVIYNDPHFYPASRYQGNRVVFPQQPSPAEPQFVVRERAPGEPGTPLVQARPGSGARALAAVSGTQGSEAEVIRRLVDVGVLLPAQGASDAERPGATSAPGLSGPPAPPAPVAGSAGPDRDERPVLRRRTAGPGDPLPR
jgi:hypothetical protein